MSAEFCPLGYDNLLCFLPDTDNQSCPNYSFCQLETAAWSLPYYFDNSTGALVVSYVMSTCRIVWTPCFIDGVFSGGFSSEVWDAHFKHTIIPAYQEFGWFPPVDNTNYVK